MLRDGFLCYCGFIVFFLEIPSYILFIGNNDVNSSTDSLGCHSIGRGIIW